MPAPDQHPLDLLPWLANDTLEEPERSQVLQHVDTCDDCRAELKLLQELRTTLQTEPHVGAGDIGLQRLLRSVRKERMRRPRWLLPAALAAGLMIAVQSGLLLQTYLGEPIYAPASGETSVTADLQIQFVPDAREADLRDLLRETDTQIVDGPSAVGLYRLKLRADADLQKVIQKLRQRSDLVIHVAPEP